MKTYEWLDYCPHIPPITWISAKSVPTFPASVSISKICTSRDLHCTIHAFSTSHQLSLNKFFDPSTPSMRKVDNRKKKKK